MKSMGSWLLGMVLVVCCAGKVVAEEPLPPAPAKRVVDEFGFFSRDPSALKRMRDAAQKLDTTHGFRLFVVVEPVLADETAQARAGRLQQAWVPKGDGLVIFFESDSRSLGWSSSYENDVARADSKAVIASHEVVRIFTNALERVDTAHAPPRYLEELVLGLAGELTMYFERRNAPEPGGRGIRLVLLVVSLSGVLVLAGLGFSLLVRRFLERKEKRFQFPASMLPQRLGAPFGGGKITVRKFDPSS